MAGPQFRADGTETTGTSATANFAKPAGMLKGDVYVGGLTIVTGTGTATTPGGWFKLPAAPLVQSSESSYVYVAREADFGTGDVSLSGSFLWSTFGVCYFDADSVSPLGASGMNGQLATTTPTATGITTTKNNGLVVALFMSTAVAAAITPPAGMTERHDASTGQEIADVLQAVAGASGNKAATASSDDYRMALLELVPNTVLGWLRSQEQMPRRNALGWRKSGMGTGRQ